MKNLSRISILILLLAGVANAESVWVSDQFEIMLRTGPSTSNAIERMLSSGTQLESLETDPGSGYSRVRTGSGIEGWVLTRYLMGEPPAREQLIRLSSELTNANAEGTSLGSQLQSIETQYRAATQRIASLESERDQLQAEDAARGVPDARGRAALVAEPTASYPPRVAALVGRSLRPAAR